MSAEGKTLVVGIGSGHGDDQAGWRVIDALSNRISSHVDLRKASVPHDLIDWLDECEVVHLVDGCEIDGDGSAVHRFDVVASPSAGVGFQESPIAAIAGNTRCLVRSPRLRSGSSHQIDVVSVLQLADRLNALPGKVVLWTVPGERFDPDDRLSPVCQAGVVNCVDRITAELYDA